jgi:phosphatidylserine/phosphatidylglycerophosphate/cardiolipin synthase-like enzyme
VGTFHAKYMVIDRRIACISSNNIQDRVNLELNLHLEGPIVDAFYDMALLSWAEPMEPPLPLLVNPSLRSQMNEGRDCFEEAKARKREL